MHGDLGGLGAPDADDASGGITVEPQDPMGIVMLVPLQPVDVVREVQERAPIMRSSPSTGMGSQSGRCERS